MQSLVPCIVCSTSLSNEKRAGVTEVRLFSVYNIVLWSRENGLFVMVVRPVKASPNSDCGLYLRYGCTPNKSVSM